ncbi:MAG: diacylglycerol kinase [Candidatus Schmidhempelia sp.]|nr:diacylglycerol kinase [Candidatus Schmidhempelia sp.]
MMKKTTGLTRIIKATKYSFQGIKAAFKHEAAFKQETYLLIATLLLVTLIEFSLYERILLVISIIFVMVIELINSAIEAIVDRIGKEHHELSGRAKDLGSAAVFLSIIITSLLWLSIFYYHFRT